MQRKLFLIFLVLILAVFLGACSSEGEQGEEGGDAQEAESVVDGVVEIEISGFKFNPEEVTIPVGTTVTWINMEAAPHSAVGDNEEWDTGGLRKNDSYSFTFDTPGTYTYHDYYYPAMSGTIIVTE